jgi:hypothetical protein
MLAGEHGVVVEGEAEQEAVLRQAERRPAEPRRGRGGVTGAGRVRTGTS